MITGSKPSNAYNMNNVTRKVSRCFRKKNKEHLKSKINESEIVIWNKNIRDPICAKKEFQVGCRSRTNTVNDETVICLQSATEFFLDGRSHLLLY